MSETILGHLPAVRFEGESSESSYSYRYYDANRIILGMPLREHPRFAVAYWHSFVMNGNDPFGSATIHRPCRLG